VEMTERRVNMKRHEWNVPRSKNSQKKHCQAAGKGPRLKRHPKRRERSQ
jgi:hypothetical protein